MQDLKQENLENLIHKLDDNRAWLLKKIDKGKWPELRNELAALERDISKFILRAKEFSSESRRN